MQGPKDLVGKLCREVTRAGQEQFLSVTCDSVLKHEELHKPVPS